MTSLSGGNQQKVALGRVLEIEPAGAALRRADPGRRRPLATRHLPVPARHRRQRQRGRDRHLRRLRARRPLRPGHRPLARPDRPPSSPASPPPRSRSSTPSPASTSSRPTPRRRRRGRGDRRGEDGRHAPRRRSWRRRHTSADGIRLLALVVLMVVLGAFAQCKNDTFLTAAGIYNVLLLALPLVAVAAAAVLRAVGRRHRRLRRRDDDAGRRADVLVGPDGRAPRRSLGDGLVVVASLGSPSGSATRSWSRRSAVTGDRDDRDPGDPLRDRLIMRPTADGLISRLGSNC